MAACVAYLSLHVDAFELQNQHQIRRHAKVSQNNVQINLCSSDALSGGYLCTILECLRPVPHSFFFLHTELRQVKEEYILLVLMIRHHLNEHEQRATALSAHVQEMGDALGRTKKAEMKQEWANIDQGWDALKQEMKEKGMSMSPANTSGTVRLNVGGSDEYVPRSVLERKQGSSSAACSVGALFGAGVWDERLPRYSGGRVFLDEDPEVFKSLY